MIERRERNENVGEDFMDRNKYCLNDMRHCYCRINRHRGCTHYGPHDERGAGRMPAFCVGDSGSNNRCRDICCCNRYDHSLHLEVSDKNKGGVLPTFIFSQKHDNKGVDRIE